jgi:hypothetical protein
VQFAPNALIASKKYLPDLTSGFLFLQYFGRIGDIEGLIDRIRHAQRK